MHWHGAARHTCAARAQQALPWPRHSRKAHNTANPLIVAAIWAGIFCAVVSHPADNMVSKLNNTKGATVGSVISEMGWMNLFTRGLPLRILMVGTLTGLQWGIYDAYKVRLRSSMFLWEHICETCRFVGCSVLCGQSIKTLWHTALGVNPSCLFCLRVCGLLSLAALPLGHEGCSF